MRQTISYARLNVTKTIMAANSCMRERQRMGEREIALAPISEHWDDTNSSNTGTPGKTG